MAQVQANGITIEYEQHGSGESLLLVMGLGGQLSDWPDGFVDALVSEEFRVTMFDNRDIGLSTELDWEPPKLVKSAVGALRKRPPEVEYTIPDMASDAAGLLAALDIDATHVVGMSMGGMIAQQLAIDHSRAVRSLTSIMSNPGDGRSGRASGKVMAKMLRRPRSTRDNMAELSTEYFKLWSGPHFDPDEHRNRVAASVERSFRPRGSERQTAAILASPDRTQGLGQITVPTLVVHGLRDRLVKPSGGIATAEAVPGSRLVMYPDMGHDLPKPRWAEIAQEIRRNADRAAVSR